MSNFKEPRELIPLLPDARAMLASEEHRLHHAVWHSVRGMWFDLPQAKKQAIRALGWQPGHHLERPAVRNGAPIVDNGSGEDFLYMHRQMIAAVQAIYQAAGKQPIRSWGGLPLPGGDPALGFDVPPNWSQADESTRRRLDVLKSDTYFWTSMRAADRGFKSAAYLSTLSLGALGATLEYNVHNDMHMRWSSVPKDPATGLPLPGGRASTDFDPKWLDPDYDFLGEFYSSHVNPVFWRLHGWVDDRIEDWFAAHETAHPGEVERADVNGIPWFKPGRWVSAEEPWSAPKSHHGGHGGHHGGLDPAVMKQVIEIIFGGAALLQAPDGNSTPPPNGMWFLQ